MMNPKSEIIPPIPARHQAIISPVNAIRRQATLAINKMSGGLGTAPDLLWRPSK